VTVAVVGGGVIGASVAYHLAARGVKSVVVLDRGAGPGEGSTGRATGGFRAQFGTDVHVRLSLLSRAKLRAFREEIGVDPGYQPRGYLWLAGDEEQLAAFAAARAVQHAAGLTEATAVSLDDVRRLNPAVSLEGIVGGAFCPTDGFLRPGALLEGYLAAAARLGARFEWGAEVVDLERDGEVVTAVATAKGRLPVEAVVNAAGPWAARVASLAGLSLPVAPLRRQVLPTAPTEVLPAEMPMTIFPDRFHLRVRDGRALLLWPEPAAEGFDTSVDPVWIERVAAMARARVPPLADVPLDRGAAYAGLYEMTPDGHALVGAAPGLRGFWLANGSSGHGVMHAPALGQLVAELVCGETPSLDLAPLRPSRFAEGAPNPGAGLL
jgi:sarcosine oxidase subunit beta